MLSGWARRGKFLQGMLNLKQSVDLAAAAGNWGGTHSWHVCDGFRKRGLSDPGDPWHQNTAAMVRKLPEFAKLKNVLEVYSDKQLKEISKTDFLQSFEVKYKGLAALFWNKLHEETATTVNLVLDDGKPETFRLTSTEELKEILDGHSAAGIKAIDDPRGMVLRNLGDVEPGRTYRLVWGLMSQAKTLGIVPETFDKG